jgi:TonB family protein
MDLFASLLTSAVVAATPATPLPWYTFNDYPMKAFEREWQGIATFAVTVAPTGRPVDCTIIVSTGHDPLDRQTCWVALKRTHFTPAHGPDGQTTYGVYRSQVIWTRPDRPMLQREPGPDLDVTVAALPAGTKAPNVVKLAYYVDSNGNPSSCTVLPESAAQPASLVQAACDQFLRKALNAPVSYNGLTVPAVKTAAVRFNVAK